MFFLVRTFFGSSENVCVFCESSQQYKNVYVCVLCSLNDDCSRVLVGYARGQLTMWDLTSGKLLRTITDAHSPGVAVLSVKFTDDKTVALMSDSGGSVFRLEFKRLIGHRTCDSQCLFSGSRGEVSH